MKKLHVECYSCGSTLELEEAKKAKTFSMCGDDMDSNSTVFYFGDNNDYEHAAHGIAVKVGKLYSYKK
jgi:hypothetical protein